MELLLWCKTHIVSNLIIENYVREEGPKYLGEALKVNSTLTQLDLDCTQENE